MKTVELVSFINGLSAKDRVKETIEIVNQSESDLILFCGHTIEFVNELKFLSKKITNRHSEVILELEDINSAKINNCLYRVSKGKLNSMYTNQLFATSGEIDENYDLADRLLNEFESKRQFKIGMKNVLVLQCGELNILKNLQSKLNRAEFRLNDNKQLLKRFNLILDHVDLFLNPIHSPMGNQGKMSKRREFLSSKKRHYFSTSNTKPKNRKLELQSLQYAYYNGSPIEARLLNIKEKSVSRLYDLS